MSMRRKRQRGAGPNTSWNDIADWYDGWAGGGSDHHRRLAIPTVLDLLALQPGEQVLDIGCGPAALAPAVVRAKASYTGIDVSPQMMAHARKRHGRNARLYVADARDLASCSDLRAGTFDATVFLFSIQNMDPLQAVLASAAWALRPGGRLVLFITHPCFRIPRQSGWGWDAGRKLCYRRVDRYLTPLPVPLRPSSSGRGAPVYSFHRPLAAYINGLTSCGFVTQHIEELAQSANQAHDRARQRAETEFPLFLALRAVKI